MIPPQQPTVDALLEDVNWVRGLARNLVRDAVMAEDIAQEAWLAALRQKHMPRSTLRAWLAGATRHAMLKAYRSERRREVHEEIAAKSIRVSSTGEIVEGLSTQLAIAEAVHGLEEPYRETLLLRYYEDLSLKQIAARMDAPISTVSARAQRGLQALREALEKRFGSEGKNWVQALLPLLDRKAIDGPRMLSVSLAATVGKIAILVFAVLAGGLGLRSMLAKSVELAPDPVVHRTLGADAPFRGNPARTVDPIPQGPSQRSSIGAAPLSITTANGAQQDGTLLARVLHSDGTPMADLPVEVRRADALDPSRTALRLRTDLHGSLTLRGLAVGDWVVAPLLGGAGRVSVQAQAPANITLVLPPGPALTGLVVDAQGEPVPHAGIWLSLTGPKVFTLDRVVQSVIPDEFLTRADQNGAFQLTTIGAARMIGARAERHSPSPAYSLSERVGDKLELRLVLGGRGGSVSGVVLDPDGNPFAGAAVFLDVGSTENPLQDGRRFTNSLPLVRTSSDGDGRFHIFGALPGPRRLLIRAPGLAPWRGDVEVRAPGNVQTVVRLQRGMTVTGKITNADAQPLKDIFVWVSRRRWTAAPDLLHAIRARTDGTGRYRIRGIEEGHCWITVDGGQRGRAVEMLVGDAQTELVHDVTLAPGLVLRGSVLDGRGRGIQGLSVRASLPGDWRSAGDTTDGAGAFTIHGLQDQEHVLRVTEGAIQLVDELHAWPDETGKEETLILLDEALRPSAAITGRLTHASGNSARVMGVHLQRVGDGWTLERKVEQAPDGTFRSHAFPPGIWRIVLRIEGHPDLPIEGQHAFAAHQVLDLDSIGLPPAGELQLHLVSPPPGQLFDLRVQVVNASGLLVCSQRLVDPGRHLPFAIPLTAGTFTIRAWASGFAPQVQIVQASAPGTVRVELRLKPGTPCALRFHMSGSAQAPKQLRLRVRAEAGEVLLEETLSRETGAPGFAFSATVALLPGVYEIEAASEGFEARGALVVLESVGGPPSQFLLEPR